MASHPINLAVRFLLELAALGIMGVWGWRQGEGGLRLLFALGIPLVAATLWGVFRVPNDPGRAPVAVPGVVRLALELAYFGFAVWALHDLGAATWSWIMGIILVIHYAASHERLRWMIGQ
jgi:hypothetical protein